jgi:putative protein kinase ArgK-like GTPase of G3E family
MEGKRAFLFLLLRFMMPRSTGPAVDWVTLRTGITEVADIIVVNKADGDTEAAATWSAHQHRMVLDLTPRRWKSWAPQVLLPYIIVPDSPVIGV